MLYAEISAWYIKLNTMKLRARNLHFLVLYWNIVVYQISIFKHSITWKQAIRCFIEYGTVERLEERTEQSYARSVTDLSYQNNLHDRFRFLT